MKHKGEIFFFLIFTFTLGSIWIHPGAAAGPEGIKSPVIERILKRGELIVGTAGNLPPFIMKTKDGRMIGFDADLAEYMADGMGVKLKLEIIPFVDLIPALEARKVDMILSGMTMTPTRNLRVAFVGPYFISGQAFLTKLDNLGTAKNASAANSPNTTLAAVKGSTSQTFVEKIIPEAKLITPKDYDEAVNLVIQDKVDGLVSDYPLVIVSVLRHREKGLVSVITPLTYEPIGIALPIEDPLLVNWVQNFLRFIEGGGELERLKTRWFKDRSWLDRLP